jgi:hypothetical protein
MDHEPALIATIAIGMTAEHGGGAAGGAGQAPLDQRIPVRRHRDRPAHAGAASARAEPAGPYR